MERIQAPHFDAEMKALVESINLQYDYDFRHYSAPSMKRTLVHAMDRMKCPTLALLQAKVLGEPACFYELVDSLTISVSEMFRDPSYFLTVRDKVVPLLRTYPSLNIWIAGCSTGEEAFSLAILLHEEGLLARTTLFATDISPRSLEKAKSGYLNLNVLEKITQNYKLSGGTAQISDYYSGESKTGTICDLIRKHITFTDHSLVTDTVFAEMQFISCRNVLIYFDRDLQDRVFGLLSESLSRRGFIGLGRHETMQFSEVASSFLPVSTSSRIYQKI